MSLYRSDYRPQSGPSQPLQTTSLSFTHTHAHTHTHTLSLSFSLSLVVKRPPLSEDDNGPRVRAFSSNSQNHLRHFPLLFPLPSVYQSVFLSFLRPSRFAEIPSLVIWLFDYLIVLHSLFFKLFSFLSLWK